MVAAILAVILASAIMAPRLQAKTGTPLAVLFAPWMSRDAVFAAVAGTGVEILRQSRLDNVVLVSADRTGLVIDLYAAGAWSVLDAGGWGGCGIFETASAHIIR
jgi:hypothetical protein